MLAFCAISIVFTSCNTTTDTKDPWKCTQGFEFTPLRDGSGYAITGWDVPGFYESTVIIPSTHNGKPVVAIESKVFSRNPIYHVIIPASVKRIESSAFYHCNNLLTVTIEEGSNLEHIGKEAFYNCIEMRRIQLPDSLKVVEENAFYLCNVLDDVWYTGSKEQWAQINIADGNGALKRAKVQHGYSQAKQPDALSYKLTDDGLAYLVAGINRFSNTINHITVPAVYNDLPVVGIRDTAFRNDKYLISITIPASVKTIGTSAFEGCWSLRSVIFQENSTLQTIGEKAFYRCVDLQSIVIPNTVTEIGYAAFFECVVLEEIVLPSSLQSVGKSAFSGCEKLTTVTIPNGLSTIPSFMFAKCLRLTSVTIPQSVTNIDENAFSECNKLKTINYTGSNSQWDAIKFANPDMFSEEIEIVFNYKVK